MGVAGRAYYKSGTRHKCRLPRKRSVGLGQKSPLNTGEKSYNVGNIYQYYAYSLAALVAGGNWGDGASCGARAVICSDAPWAVDTYIGARGACDSL